jgi:phage terminase Nu1 subunit (DNA packaging protein)
MAERDSATVTGLPTQQVERYVTRRELAGIMGVSVGTIDNMVRAGMPSTTWGRRTRRFRPSTAIAWAQERRAAA